MRIPNRILVIIDMLEDLRVDTIIDETVPDVYEEVGQVIQDLMWIYKGVIDSSE